MNGEQLLDAFSCLDDELIERSEAAAVRAAWRKWSGMAACAAVLAVALLASRGLWQRPDAQSVQSAAQFASGYTPAPGETDVVTAPVERVEGDTEPAVSTAPVIEPDKTDAAGREAAVSPPAAYETLTETEARSDAAFGAYICHAPAGFGEREFLRTPEQLCASYRRGYEYLDWNVRAFGDADRERLVTAVAETERYDVSLYTIPYADSVPEELRAVFYDPIFRIEDMTLDLVEARAYRINEPGDSDGWRTSFSVLYGDVLVRVSAKGVSPEWLYQQLAALG